MSDQDQDKAQPPVEFPEGHAERYAEAQAEFRAAAERDLRASAAERDYVAGLFAGVPDNERQKIQLAELRLEAGQAKLDLINKRQVLECCDPFKHSTLQWLIPELTKAGEVLAECEKHEAELRTPPNVDHVSHFSEKLAVVFDQALQVEGKITEAAANRRKVNGRIVALAHTARYAIDQNVQANKAFKTRQAVGSGGGSVISPVALDGLESLARADKLSTHVINEALADIERRRPQAPTDDQLMQARVMIREARETLAGVKERARAKRHRETQEAKLGVTVTKRR